MRKNYVSHLVRKYQNALTVSPEELKDYQKHYNKNAAYKLLKSLRKATRDKPAVLAGPAGKVVEILGSLLSALDNPATPTAARAMIIGAIGYIVLPVDLIPDALPVVGWTDDIASAGGVLMAVKAYSTFRLEDLDMVIDRER